MSLKVSIVAISFNQEAYIKQTLDSFIEQVTDFSFEIIIADDASSDATPTIIQKYARRFPDIIKPILRRKNIGVQPNLIDALRHAKGTYIALCEGDDFWIDPKKLQKQVDFLDRNTDYSLCFHPVRMFFEDGSQPDLIYPNDILVDTPLVTAKMLAKKNYIQTNSVVYRKQSYDNIPEDILPLDWYLHLYHAQYGKIGYINEVMSAYRRHSGGIWWDSVGNIDAIWVKYGMSHTKLFIELAKLYANDKDILALLKDNRDIIIDNLIDIDNRQSTHFTDELLTLYPFVMQEYLKSRQKKLRSQADIIIEHEVRISQLSLKAKKAEETATSLQAQLMGIHSSKLWKIGGIYRKAKDYRLRR